jgi:hypothetical protein
MAEPWRVIKRGHRCPSCKGNRPLELEGLRLWGRASALNWWTANTVAQTTLTIGAASKFSTPPNAVRATSRTHLRRGIQLAQPVAQATQ